jgi:hypothetical protein
VLHNTTNNTSKAAHIKKNSCTTQHTTQATH